MTFMNRLLSYILYYQIFNSEYCISSVLIGSLNSAYQLILQVTSRKCIAPSVVEFKKVPNTQDLMELDDSICNCWIQDCTYPTRNTPLIGYLTSHISSVHSENNW